MSDPISNMYLLRDILKECWSKETAHPKTLKWAKRGRGRQRPSTGQCFVTALVVRDLFGGKILTGIVERKAIWIDDEGEIEEEKTWTERHYWNIIDEKEYDFTSDQYGGDGYHPISGMVGNVSKVKGKSNKRYKMLKECVLNKLDELGLKRLI